EIESKGSIHRAIEVLQSEGRTLRPLTNLEEYSDVTISLAEMTDPERAVGLDQLMAQFSFGAEFHRPPRAFAKVGLATALTAGLAAAWRLTPLRKMLSKGEPENLLARVWKRLRR
ncbi:MAG: hypothetical protein ACREV0_08650, partial [Burkholderiales bacterium]